MAAIFGAIRLGSGPPVERHLVERMVGASTARSRAEASFATHEYAVLAVREGRNAPSLAQGRRQITAVWDGVPLNADQLARELGVRADDLIPELYEAYDLDFIRRLDGGFGVALVDDDQRRAMLARDHIGIKPLYYAASDEVLVFASELRPILATGLVGSELNYPAIDAYLGFGFVPSPDTILQGVSKLPPAHRLVIENGALRTERYWDYPEPTHPPRTVPVSEHTDQLLQQLDAALRARLDDGSTGIMLSGGLDSSLLTVLAARSGAAVKTFTVGFSETRDASELEAARALAQAVGTDHHELELSIRHDAAAIEDLVAILEEPVADISALGLLALTGVAVSEAAVVLSGQGADGLLGGQPAHRTARLLSYTTPFPAPVRDVAAGLLSRGNDRTGRLGRLIAARTPVDRFLAAADRLGGGARAQLLRGPLGRLDRTGTEIAATRVWKGMKADPLGTFIYIDEQLGAPDSLLHYVDRAAASGPVDARFPFLDRRVVEFCAGVPSSQKVRRLTGKYILRAAARGVVPDEVIDRPKIGFFNTAVDGWVQARGREDIARYLTDDARCAEFIDVAGVRALPDTAFQLRVLMLEVWLTSLAPLAIRRRADAIPVGVAR